MMRIMASLTKAATVRAYRLEIPHQAAIAADPGQGSFDDPTFGQDDEFRSAAACRARCRRRRAFSRSRLSSTAVGMISPARVRTAPRIKSVG